MYDDATMVRFPYAIERGRPLPGRARAERGQSAEIVFETRQPLLINRDVDGFVRAQGLEMPVMQGEEAKAVLFAPMIVGDEVRGRISLQNLDREDAFSESDLRLLTTLAASLSVALENARLFDETRRLLGETNERAAELALINDVQRGLAEKLDMQAMYDLVGDRIQAIFDAQVVDIGIYDAGDGARPLPVLDRARRALPGRARPIAELPATGRGDRAAADRQ